MFIHTYTLLIEWKHPCTADRPPAVQVVKGAGRRVHPCSPVTNDSKCILVCKSLSDVPPLHRKHKLKISRQKIPLRFKNSGLIFKGIFGNRHFGVLTEVRSHSCAILMCFISRLWILLLLFLIKVGWLRHSNSECFLLARCKLLSSLNEYTGACHGPARDRNLRSEEKVLRIKAGEDMSIPRVSLSQ